ncbi:MAG: hypothetical protein ACFFB5_22410 [Promethearchaeota archaeon]
MKEKYDIKKRLMCFFLFSAIFIVSSLIIIGEATPSDLNNEIEQLKEKIQNTPNSCWRKPSRIRKAIIIRKLTKIEQLILDENFEEAYEKFLHDIKPKLTGLKTDNNEESWSKNKFSEFWSKRQFCYKRFHHKGWFITSWVICHDLREEFRVDCNNILEALITSGTPDVNPPIIILTPDQTFSDGETIGGILIEWEITDDSGLSEVSVNLNGMVIASYQGDPIISDSYLLSNIPGNNLVEITAIDTNGLESSATSNILVIDDDTTPPVISVNYYGEGHEDDPGVWSVNIVDLGDGLDEVLILVDGNEEINEQNLNGISTKSYDVTVPGDIGTHTIEIIVKDNDKDWDGDQLANTKSGSVEIVESPGDGDIPPILDLP